MKKSKIELMGVNIVGHQGDVFFIKVPDNTDFSQGETLKADEVGKLLIHGGEALRHDHAFYNPDAIEVKIARSLVGEDGKENKTHVKTLFMTVKSHVLLKHQEHKAKLFSPNKDSSPAKYIGTTQREQLQGMVRPVTD